MKVEGHKPGRVRVDQVYEHFNTKDLYLVVKLDELQDQNQRLIGYRIYQKPGSRLFWRTEANFLEAMYIPEEHFGGVEFKPRFKCLGLRRDAIDPGGE